MVRTRRRRYRRTRVRYVIEEERLFGEQRETIVRCAAEFVRARTILPWVCKVVFRTTDEPWFLPQRCALAQERFLFTQERSRFCDKLCGRASLHFNVGKNDARTKGDAVRRLPCVRVCVVVQTSIKNAQGLTLRCWNLGEFLIQTLYFENLIIGMITMLT